MAHRCCDQVRRLYEYICFILVLHSVITRDLHHHFIKEVVYSEKNNGRPLGPDNLLHPEAFAAWGKAQPAVADFLEAASQRTYHHGEALPVTAVARQVDAAAFKLAEKESRRAVAHTLHAGALAKVCLDGTVSEEALCMMRNAIQLIRDDLKENEVPAQKQNEDAQLATASAHLCIMLVVRRGHPEDITLAEVLLVNNLSLFLPKHAQHAQDCIKDSSLGLLAYGSEASDIRSLLWPSLNLNLDYVEHPVARLFKPITSGVEQACRDEDGMVASWQRIASAQGLQVDQVLGNFASCDIVVRPAPGAAQPGVIVEAKHYQFRRASNNKARAHLDTKGVEGYVPSLNDHEVAEVAILVLKMRRPAHFNCSQEFKDALAKLFVGTDAEELYMVFLVPMHLFAREAGGRPGWKRYIDIIIALEGDQLVLRGPACILMSATLSINGGRRVPITKTLELVKSLFLEPGWKLRTVVDVAERCPVKKANLG